MNLAILLVTSGATLFALLSWLSARQREPFTLSEKRENIAKLTRTKRSSVQLRGAHVHGLTQIISRDNAATLEFRQMDFDNWIILDVQQIPVGETVIVEYRHVWPWDALNTNGKTTGAKKEKRQTRREQVTAPDSKGWKIWCGTLM